MSDMIMPQHRDRALALRAELAWLRGDYDVLPLLAAEAKTAEDVDLFIVALLDSFARVLRKRLKNPVGYLESWIAIEQPFADAEKAADESHEIVQFDNGDDDGRGSVVD